MNKKEYDYSKSDGKRVKMLLIIPFNVIFIL